MTNSKTSHDPGARVPKGLTMNRTIEPKRGLLYRMAWSPDGRILAVGTEKDSVYLCDKDNVKAARMLEGHDNNHVHDISWSPDGSLLASAADDGAIRIWDPKLASLDNVVPACPSEIYSIAWSPDGDAIAAGSRDETIRIWDYKGFSVRHVLRKHEGAVNVVVWSPDGRALASGSDDATVRVWNSHTGTLERTLKAESGWVSSLLWLAKRTDQIASPHRDSRIRLWQTNTGSLLCTLEGHEDAITCISASHDGNLLATKSDDATVRLWSTKTWRCVGLLDEPGTPNMYFPSVAFHPKEPLLATLGENDTVIRLWDYDPSLILDQEQGSEEWVPLSLSTSMHLQVFLCHASEDKSIVRELYNRLKADGVKAWLDEEDLLPGQDWRLEISKAVKKADVFIVCVSAAAVGKSGYVQSEIKFALDIADEKPEGTIFLIPLRLDSCSVPDRLRQWQWVDYFTKDGYNKLMRALRKRLENLRPR